MGQISAAAPRCARLCHEAHPRHMPAGPGEAKTPPALLVTVAATEPALFSRASSGNRPEARPSSPGPHPSAASRFLLRSRFGRRLRHCSRILNEPLASSGQTAGRQDRSSGSEIACRTAVSQAAQGWPESTNPARNGGRFHRICPCLHLCSMPHLNRIISKYIGICRDIPIYADIARKKSSAPAGGGGGAGASSCRRAGARRSVFGTAQIRFLKP